MATKVRSAKIKQNYLHSIWIEIRNRLMWACRNTNLHGFKFVASKDASIITRLFFAVVSCLSLSLCSYLIVVQLYDYNQQLIVTRIISTAYPVWKFRFPSATICNFNVVHKNNLNNLTNLVTSHGIKQEIFMDFIQNLSALITYDDNLGNMDHYKEIYEVLEANGYTVERTMSELAQPCSNMVKKCFWRASEIPCSQIIQKTRTTNGYCCSFNYYGRRKLSESVIDPQNLNDTYMGLIGSNYGLRLLLDAEEDQYVSAIKPSYGFNILVQDGADYPDMSLTTSTLLIAEEMKVSVKPSIYVSSKSVRDTDLDQRRCLFEDEGHIDWTSIYSFRGCLTQCTAAAIYSLCGCIPFYYAIKYEGYGRREPSNVDLNISKLEQRFCIIFSATPRRLCTLFDEPCLELNKYKYTTLHIVENNSATDKEDHEEAQKYEEDRTNCECYPQCNERIFNVQSSRYSVTSTFGHENENLSILNVYYNGANCIKTKRDVYYTWYRILSAVGGIFSLCLGGSIISVVECCYIFGKCIYKYNNVESNPDKVSKPVVTYINVNAPYVHRNNLKKKSVANAKAHMFVKAFGNP